MTTKPNPPVQPDPNNPSPFPSPPPANPAVVAAAQKYGPQLNVPIYMNGTALMLAMTANESSWGHNAVPRHEPAYDVGGSVYAASDRQYDLVTKYGSAAACSYGPWQMMFINFSDGTTPESLADVDVCAQEFVRFFNSYVIKIRRAQSLPQIGQVWNAGHVYTATVPPAVAQYVAKLEDAYATAKRILA